MNTLRQSTITGWGLYAPKRVATNDDLARVVDTSDEWIQSRSGIKERHLVGPDEHTSTMSAAAAERAMQQAGVTAADLDLILVATSTPDYLTPPVSSQIQDMLGAQCGAMSLVVGCTGFVYAVVTAHQFIATGAARTVLVIGAETISRNLNWEDRTTCVLFGDGAGAVVMQATEEAGAGVMSFVLGSDGSGAEHLIQKSGGVRHPPTAETIAAGDNYLRMNGREVFKFATTKMGESLEQVLTQAEMSADDIDLFVPHQANARIIEYAAQRAGISMEKVVMNVERYGNTSAATIPIALAEAFDAGRAKPGDTLALVGFGAGLTWAACLFKLAAEPVATDAPEHVGAVEGWIA